MAPAAVFPQLPGCAQPRLVPGAIRRKQGTVTSSYAAPASPQAPAPDARAEGLRALPRRGPQLTPRRRRRWSRVTAGVATVLVCLFGFLAAASAVQIGRA